MLSMGSGARLGEHLKKYRDKQREEQRGHRLNDFISKIKKVGDMKINKITIDKTSAW